jgi:uncharacterized protein (TIGR02246 family)
MKIRLLSALVVGLAIGFVLPTVAQQKDAFDPKQQIRVLAKKDDDAVNKRDPVAVAALYTQDGVLTTYDHGSFRGRKAIENAYARWYFKAQFSNYFTTVNRVTAVGKSWAISAPHVLAPSLGQRTGIDAQGGGSLGSGETLRPAQEP